jgi:isocitrate/isopropylmalate dehydrogenase
MMSRRSPTIVLLGGEGIGPEVVEAAASVLAALLPQARFVRPPQGEEARAAYGEEMPAPVREACLAADAILFGATLQHTRAVLRFLRWGLETYANLRPARTLPGLSGRANPLKIAQEGRIRVEGLESDEALRGLLQLIWDPSAPDGGEELAEPE